MLPSPSPSDFSDVDVTDWVRRTQGGTNGSTHLTATNDGTANRDVATNANTNANGNTTPNGKRVPAQLFETPPSSLLPYRIEQTPPASHSRSRSHSYIPFEHYGSAVNGGLTHGSASPPASSRSKHSFAETPSGDLSNHNLLNGSPLLQMRDVTGSGGGASLTSMTAAMNNLGNVVAAEAMLYDAATRNGSPTARGAAGTGVTPMLSHTGNGNENGGGPGSAGTSRSAITATRMPTFFR